MFPVILQPLSFLVASVAGCSKKGDCVGTVTTSTGYQYDVKFDNGTLPSLNSLTIGFTVKTDQTVKDPAKGCAVTFKTDGNCGLKPPVSYSGPPGSGCGQYQSYELNEHKGECWGPKR